MPEITSKAMIGIIGSGQMGQGIAEVFLHNGHPIFIHDTDSNQLNTAIDSLHKRLHRAYEKGTLDANQKIHFLNNITPCHNLVQFASCDLIIEAIIEDFDTKTSLFERLGKHQKNTCILATNTSSFSITSLAKHVKSPERFLGIHFFNPAHHMPLVEIIPHQTTHPDVTRNITQFITTVGKTPVTCQDSPGFIVNRLLLPLINQATILLESGTATADAIDTAMTLGANFPMGPLALADLIGLDTCLSILATLHESSNDSSLKPSSLLKQYVANGKLGRKSGEGFFRYSL